MRVVLLRPALVSALTIATVAVGPVAFGQSLEASAPPTAAPVTAAPPTAVNSADAPAPREAAADHPTPRLTLSYQRFSIDDGTGAAMPLQALHLDVHALSLTWVRGGFELEAGCGQGNPSGLETTAKYGLLGVNAGVQFPGRVTPFLEGRLAGGVLGAKVSGTLILPGATFAMNDVSAVTWMYARGLDAGIAVYVVGRAYVSLALGWVRTTWGNPDYQLALPTAGASVTFKDATRDSLLFKIGLGI